MDTPLLFDAEARLMELIWENGPLSSTALAKLSLHELGWKKSTVYSVLKRLADRGILQNENALVTSLLSREQVQQCESRRVVEKSFGDSLPCFVAAFLQNHRLSEKEAEQLRQMIEKAAP